MSSKKRQRELAQRTPSGSSAFLKQWLRTTSPPAAVTTAMVASVRVSEVVMIEDDDDDDADFDARPTKMEVVIGDDAATTKAKTELRKRVCVGAATVASVQLLDVDTVLPVAEIVPSKTEPTEDQPPTAEATGRRRYPGDPYYLRSFWLVLSCVLQSDAHLFTGDEHARLQTFAQLPLDARCLFVRLFMRKGPWFVVNGLDYEELARGPAVKALLATGLAWDEQSLLQRATARPASAPLGAPPPPPPPPSPSLARSGTTAAAAAAGVTSPQSPADLRPLRKTVSAPATNFAGAFGLPSPPPPPPRSTARVSPAQVPPPVQVLDDGDGPCSDRGSGASSPLLFESPPRPPPPAKPKPHVTAPTILTIDDSSSESEAHDSSSGSDLEVSQATETGQLLDLLIRRQRTPTEDVQQLLETLTLPDLKTIAQRIGVHKPGAQQKREMVAAIAQRVALTTGADAAGEVSARKLVIVLSAVKSTVGRCIRLDPAFCALIDRIKRIFFLTEYRVGEWQTNTDLSMAMLSEIARMKYHPYVVDIRTPVWATRAELLLYEEALEVAQYMETVVEQGDDEAATRCLQLVIARLPSAASTGHEEGHDNDSSSNSKPHLKQTRPPFPDDNNGDDDEASGDRDRARDAGESPLVPVFRRFSAPHVYVRLANFGVSLLEKARDYASAISLLRTLLSQPVLPHKRGHWYDRLTVNLVHLHRKDEAIRECERGLADPFVRRGGLITLQRRVERLRKQRKVVTGHAAPLMDDDNEDSLPADLRETVIEGYLLRKQTAVRSLFEGRDGPCSVEALCLQYYYHIGGWEGIHCEGSIFLTLFGLLMWEVIFAQLPDVFRNPFQAAPLDLSTDTFYRLRREAIHARLDVIRECPDLGALVQEAWVHEDVQCRGVGWKNHPKEELVHIARCFGSHVLACVCERLAKDYRHWARGMPDLFLWRADERARVVEVKGPRDRLSDIQRAWIAALRAAGCDVEVCRVKELEGRPQERPMRGSVAGNLLQGLLAEAGVTHVLHEPE